MYIELFLFDCFIYVIKIALVILFMFFNQSLSVRLNQFGNLLMHDDKPGFLIIFVLTCLFNKTDD
jgi:hypothetical protein